MPQRKMIRLALAVLIVSSVSVSYCNAEDEKPLDLVKKGVKFLGGEKNLKKYKALTMEEKGVFYGMGEGMSYTGKSSLLGSSKFRMEIVGFFTQVFDGEKGWMREAGQTRNMSENEVKEMKAQQYAGMVIQLYPVVNKRYEFSFDGKSEVQGKKTVIVKVKKTGKTDVRLFFEPTSGALVKSEYYAPMEGMPEKNVKYEIFYSDYKSDGKIKYASKYRMTRDGKKFLESTVTSFKSAEKFPPGSFVKPD